MPRLSEKGFELPSSPIRKLVPYAEQAKKRGIRVLHLNIGQPDIPTPQVALEAVKNLGDKVLEYSHSAGNESYRCKLLQYYSRVGIELELDNVMTTVGGSEALLMSFLVCMNPGDEVITPEPFYANYNSFAIEAGVVLRPVPSTIENDFALPPVKDFEKLITPRTKAILLCNPNNPTGYVYSREEMEIIGAIVKRHDIYLICDEVYREFTYDGERPFSSLNLKGLEDNVVMIDSVSKRYSMCGVRLGTLVTRNAGVFDGAMKIAQARLSPPYIAQVAAEAAVDAPESYFQEVNAEYKRRRDCIVEALNKIEGVYCPLPKGAFYTIVQLPVDDSDRFARWMLEEFSWEGKTVMLAPGSGFYATSIQGHNQVRIAYVINTDDLIAAAKCIEEGLKVYPGRTSGK